MKYQIEVDDTEVYLIEVNTPEKALLTAMVERAFLDLDYLSSISLDVVAKSVLWFTDDSKFEISYPEVCEHLEFGQILTDAIAERVAEAKSFVEAVRSGVISGTDKKIRLDFAFDNGHAVIRRPLRGKYTA